jgi:pectin methylesterase-like acyl-CoA thioesterase
MKLLALIPIVLLTGCLATPVKRNFPEVPQELLTACPDLSTVSAETDKLSDVLKVVTTNYGQYQECQIKVDAWTEWYKTQKQIFDSVK